MHIYIVILHYITLHYITLHYTFQQMVCLVLIAIFKFLGKTEAATRTQDREPVAPCRTK